MAIWSANSKLCVLLCYLWNMVSAAKTSESMRKYGMVPVLILTKSWWYQPKYWITVRFSWLDWSWAICKVTVVYGGCSWWDFGRMNHSLLLFPTWLIFSYKTSVPRNFHVLVYISFKNRVRLWRWPMQTWQQYLWGHHHLCFIGQTYLLYCLLGSC